MFRLSLVPFCGRSLYHLSRNVNTGSSLHKNVAVVLSGSGVYDGTEIHEASAVLVHLSRADININIFAPDIPQMHVVNHTNGEVPEGELRNVLVESARIARGKVSPLSELDVNAHDAVVFPGGFGAAKNLSSFAVDGANCKVNDDVVNIITAFHTAKKPIGLCCIAPVLAAKTIPGCQVTLGQDLEDGGKWPYAGATAAVKEMGSIHINRDVDEVNIDEKNKIVTTPAFMCETKVHHIHDGIGKMIHAVLSLIK